MLNGCCLYVKKTCRICILIQCIVHCMVEEKERASCVFQGSVESLEKERDQVIVKLEGSCLCVVVVVVVVMVVS